METMAASPAFKVGENVKAYFKDQLYEALIVQIEMSKKECPYKVHYKGWNKRLDEFLPEGRIIKEGGDYKIDITASPIICSEGSSDSAKVIIKRGYKKKLKHIEDNSDPSFVIKKESISDGLVNKKRTEMVQEHERVVTLKQIDKIRDSKHDSSRKSIDESPRKSTDESSRRSTDESSRKSIDESARKSIDESSRKSIDESSRKSTDESSRKSIDESARESIDESSRKSTDESSRKSTDELSRKNTDELSRKSLDESSRKNTDESSRKRIDESSRKSTDESSRKSLDESSRQSIDESSRESIDESSRESIDESSRESIDESRRKRQPHFQLTIPKVLAEVLKYQDDLLSDSSNENEKSIPKLPWQSKLPTVGEILELFIIQLNENQGQVQGKYPGQGQGQGQGQRQGQVEGQDADEVILKKRRTSFSTVEKDNKINGFPDKSVFKYETLCRKIGTSSSSGSSSSSSKSDKSESFDSTYDETYRRKVEDDKNNENRNINDKEKKAECKDSNMDGVDEEQIPKPSEIYGVEHLLRMLYMLPKLLLVPQELLLEKDEREIVNGFEENEKDEKRLRTGTEMGTAVEKGTKVGTGTGTGIDDLSLSDIEIALQEYSIVFNELISFILQEKDKFLLPYVYPNPNTAYADICTDIISSSSLSSSLQSNEMIEEVTAREKHNVNVRNNGDNNNNDDNDNNHDIINYDNYDNNSKRNTDNLATVKKSHKKMIKKKQEDHANIISKKINNSDVHKIVREDGEKISEGSEKENIRVEVGDEVIPRPSFEVNEIVRPSNINDDDNDNYDNDNRSSNNDNKNNNGDDNDNDNNIIDDDNVDNNNNNDNNSDNNDNNKIDKNKNIIDENFYNSDKEVNNSLDDEEKRAIMNDNFNNKINDKEINNCVHNDIDIDNDIYQNIKNNSVGLRDHNIITPSAKAIRQEKYKNRINIDIDPSHTIDSISNIIKEHGLDEESVRNRNIADDVLNIDNNSKVITNIDNSKEHVSVKSINLREAKMEKEKEKKKESESGLIIGKSGKEGEKEREKEYGMREEREKEKEKRVETSWSRRNGTIDHHGSNSENDINDNNNIMSGSRSSGSNSSNNTDISKNNDDNDNFDIDSNHGKNNNDDNSNNTINNSSSKDKKTSSEQVLGIKCKWEDYQKRDKEGEKMKIIDDTDVKSCAGIHLITESVSQLIAKQLVRKEEGEKVGKNKVVEEDEGDEEVDELMRYTEEKKKFEKEELKKRTAADPNSWKCTKCSELNSVRARSCDVCDEKKPLKVLVKISNDQKKGVDQRGKWKRVKKDAANEIDKIIKMEMITELEVEMKKQTIEPIITDLCVAHFEHESEAFSMDLAS